uniref:Uncharacterized protein n=1 Tax=Micromonas pusilla TaxID=38833 RepID=A0A6U0N0R4_MICPS|mmetsp:Transcript_12465/g.52675  ORF Transcript_12465/g.52675 Transcript_12465/m.52675 type:complete len:149 (+) Transcript_12465:1590-2036(+)
MGFASLTISDGANSGAELIGCSPSLSAVETPATGDVTEKEKPWKAYPKLTVYKENEENPCNKCRHNASGCDTCLSPLEFQVRHTLKRNLWLQENPGKDLPKALGRMIKFAMLADNEGTLKPKVAEMFQEACDEVRKALDADGLKDWKV